MENKNLNPKILLIITLFIIIVFSIIGISSDIKYEKLCTEYDKLSEENEMLHTYIENIDTYKSLDDAIKYRDDLYYQLQFIDE